MRTECTKCDQKLPTSEFRNFVRSGTYRRKSDCRKIQLYRCLVCGRRFIRRNPCHGQNKRQANDRLYKGFASGLSIRRMAMIYNLNRKTVARKLRFLGKQAAAETRIQNLKTPKTKVVVFDDLETFEHTKCKPLSVTIAVDQDRRILGFKVAQMAAKGNLAKMAFKKYGPRKDSRSSARNALFNDLKDLVEEDATFRSDQNPYYPKDLKNHFPKATHETHKGQRGSTTGQGELKKIRFDPLFALNHTCAMHRANINRLFRRTWCTTKLRENLEHHIAIYVKFHNFELLRV